MEEIGQQVDTLMFCDVAGSGAAPRFLIRYLGRRLQEAYGGARTGEYLDDVLPAVWREGAMKTYQQAITGRPVYNIVETRDRGGCDVLLERLILPFTTSVGVDRILSSVETISAEGKFEQAGLSESPFVGSNCLINAVIDAD